MKVRDLMTTDVVTVSPAASLKDVARALVEHRISGMPVCGEAGDVLGVISEGDILHRERGRPEPGRGPLAWFADGTRSGLVSKARARTAREAMTAPAITVAPYSSAASAARLMVEKRINRLPVVSTEEGLVGIITRADLVRAFTRTDAEIEHEIRQEILTRTLWVDPPVVGVAVHHGDVELTGHLPRASDVDVLVRLVELVPGVLSVSSHVTHRIDDGRGMLAETR
jgi:CBS domain-containing protein